MRKNGGGAESAPPVRASVNSQGDGDFINMTIMLTTDCNPTDVVIMLGITEADDLSPMASFVIALSQSLPISSGQIRIGVMTFKTTQITAISLGQCYTMMCITSAANRLQFVR